MRRRKGAASEPAFAVKRNVESTERVENGTLERTRRKRNADPAERVESGNPNPGRRLLAAEKKDDGGD